MNNDKYRKAPPGYYVRLGRLLRGARESAGLNQRDLAGTLGVSERTVGYWETGERRIPTDRVDALCKALGTTPNYLLGEAGKRRSLKS